MLREKEKRFRNALYSGFLHETVDFSLLSCRYLTRKRRGEGGKREEGSRERGEGREGS